MLLQNKNKNKINLYKSKSHPSAFYILWPFDKHTKKFNMSNILHEGLYIHFTNLYYIMKFMYNSKISKGWI
jgi:hypothetical protein